MCYPCFEELAFAERCITTLGSQIKLEDAKKRTAKFASIVLEAKILSCLEDSSLTDAAKKAKLSKYSTTMGEYSTEYNVEMKTCMMPQIVTEAVNRVVSRARS